ncbi:tail fiber domain-containing protein [Luteitalea sp.]|uniref:tail fiber domain-containing protein n=1 Tax=Luteitalea sp. TaxID=2004800 RepID=UPI0025BD6DDB|nr:tail fiber domain-containing protein [Luteitalea sp.]
MLASVHGVAAQTANVARFSKVTISASTDESLTVTRADTGVGNTPIVAVFARTGAAPTSTARGVAIAFRDANNETVVGAIAGVRTNSASNFNGELAFYTNAGAGSVSNMTGMTERMRITADGRVGIGTTSPDAGLEIAAAYVTSGATVPTGFALGGQAATARGQLIYGDGSGYTFNMGPVVSGAFAARFVFDDRGQLLLVSPSGSRSKLRFQDAGADETGVEMDDANNELVLTTNSGLQATVLGTTASAANMFYDSTTDEILRSTSSRRYKADIHALDVRVRDVLQLAPVLYKDARKLDGPDYPGFIAEDVAKLFPELVTYDAEGRPDYVQYDRVPAYLLVALRDLAARVQRLERRR